MTQGSLANETSWNVLEAVQTYPIVILSPAPFRCRLHHDVPVAVHVVVGRRLEGEVGRRRRGFQDDSLFSWQGSCFARVLESERVHRC